jgi:prepilin-type N-terminal cleavage/methylation domain-containing protein
MHGTSGPHSGEADQGRPIRKWAGFTLIELLVVILVIGCLIALLMPATRNASGAARRTECLNHCKQIALALHNYADKYGSLPPVYTVDAAGRPLHSWRTLILPFLEQQALYDRIDLTKPWDDPANAAARATRVPEYQCPSVDIPANYTTYLGLVGNDHCFHPGRACRFADLKGGTSGTAMVVEAAPQHAVPWMAPQDTDGKYLVNLTAESGLAHDPGTHIALADGSVQFVSHEVPLAERRALARVVGSAGQPARAATRPLR